MGKILCSCTTDGSSFLHLIFLEYLVKAYEKMITRECTFPLGVEVLGVPNCHASLNPNFNNISNCAVFFSPDFIRGCPFISCSDKDETIHLCHVSLKGPITLECHLPACPKTSALLISKKGCNFED